MKRLLHIAATPVLALALAQPASAAVFTGSTSDPSDVSTASIDVRRVSTTIDTDAGTWTTKYTFQGKRTSSTRADLQLGFELPPGADGAPKQGGFALVKLRGLKTTVELHDEQLGPQEDTTQDTATATREGKTLTIVVNDARIVGTTPVALSKTRVSYRVRDADYVPRFKLKQR